MQAEAASGLLAGWLHARSILRLLAVGTEAIPCKQMIVPRKGGLFCCRTTPRHVVRCVLGTTLRLAVYGSVLNLGLSFAGKTQGFWATKVFTLLLFDSPCLASACPSKQSL